MGPEGNDTLHTCGVCYSEYTEKVRCPKVLRCGHTFCYSCVKACAENSDPGIAVACPSCRTVTVRPPATIPTNYQLLQLLSSQKLLENESVIAESPGQPENRREEREIPEAIGAARFHALLESLEEEFDILRVRAHEEGRSHEIEENGGAESFTELINMIGTMFEKVTDAIENPTDDTDDERVIQYPDDDASAEGSDYSIDYDHHFGHEYYDLGLYPIDRDWGDYLRSEGSEPSVDSRDHRPQRDHCTVCDCVIPNGGESRFIHESGRRHLENVERRRNNLEPVAATPRNNNRGRRPFRRNNGPQRDRSNSPNENQPPGNPPPYPSRGGNRGRGRGAPRGRGGHIHHDDIPIWW